MATTYSRLRAVLLQARKKADWPSREGLASEIARRRLAPFRLRGDGSSLDHFMKVGSVDSLLEFAEELGLLSNDRDGRVSITEQGSRALNTDDAFALQVRSSIKSYLAKKQLSLDKLFQVIAAIRPPEVTDAVTIFERVKLLNPRPSLTQSELRRILYLSYCAKSIDRKLRIHYEQLAVQ